MKKIYKYISLLFMVTCFFVSCESFQDINTNVQGVTPKMAERDGVASGGFIQNLERNVIPVGTAANKTDIINTYQVAYHLGPDTWSGYFGQNANWNGGRNHTTYSLINGWINASYQAAYTNSYSSWLSIKNNKALNEHPESYALAQILKVSTWHKATDMFGPIPYTKAGTGLYITPYDSQEEVYKSMLSDLEDAIKVLMKYNDDGGLLFPNYDLIYSGNTAKWIKYANSLMLRLAMRIRYADPVLAKNYAEMAVSNKVGVMIEKEDGASISFAHNLQFINPIETFAVQYGECRMGTPAYSYLAGYKDPRLSVYYKPSTSAVAIMHDWANGKYLPIPVGTGVKSFSDCSLPNIEKNTPVHWLLTSEVYFLRAEGALVGWNMGGTSEELYTRGIEMSFAENNIPASKVSGYINSGLKPSAVDLTGLNGFNSSYAAPSEATVKFDGNEEQKLEKIIIQKYLALFPNGMEAWTEWRRTGYPKLQNVANNYSGGVINTDTGIRRMHYFIKDSQTADEAKAYSEAVSLLGGDDTPATNLWWDKKNSK